MVTHTSLCEVYVALNKDSGANHFTGTRVCKENLQSIKTNFIH